MGSALGWPLVVAGALLLAGFLAHEVGRRAHVPRVTILLLVGVIAGPSGLGLLPDTLSDFFPLTAEVTLSMVGFLLGEQFFGKKLRDTGRVVLGVTLAQSFGATVCVFLGLFLVGAPPVLALSRVRLKIGLATARRAAEEAGGRLSIESSPGKGTRATVTLPVAKEVPEAVPTT